MNNRSSSQTDFNKQNNSLVRNNYNRPNADNRDYAAQDMNKSADYGDYDNAPKYKRQKDNYYVSFI